MKGIQHHFFDLYFCFISCLLYQMWDQAYPVHLSCTIHCLAYAFHTLVCVESNNREVIQKLSFIAMAQTVSVS